MANKLSMHAQEGSTFIIIAEFFAKTSDGSEPSPVIPNEGLTWTLRDEAGNVINERLDVPLVSGESATIVLQGDDLVLSSNYPEKRYVTIKGTFNSSLGTDLPLVDEVEFQVDDVVGINPLL